MTAITIIRQHHRIAVLTDTALYDVAGTVIGFGQKAAAIPNLNTVIATRGSAILPGLFSMLLGMRFQSFDALIRDGGSFLKEGHQELYPLLAGEKDFQLYVAGWSEESGRPEVYFLGSADDADHPWIFDQLDDDAFFLAPHPGRDLLRQQGFQVGKRIADMCPVSDGLKIIEAQRRFTGHPTRSGDGPELHLVGGAALLMEIRRDGISQRIIKRWNDKIGEPIEPEPFEVSQAPSYAGMNRQQRRAAARKPHIAA